MFTFIVGKILIFFLHNSQKCSTFALELKTIVTITIKPGASFRGNGKSGLRLEREPNYENF